MSKRDQFNIGDQVAVYGEVIGTPPAGTVVNPNTMYRVRIKGNETIIPFALREMDTLIDDLKDISVKPSPAWATRYGFPFPERISEIIIKYK